MDGRRDGHPGGTGASYTLTEDDEGLTIQVWVSFTDDVGNEETLTSAATEAVAATPNTSARGRPTISGTVRVGVTLTADTTGIDDDGLPITFTYQWVQVASDDTETDVGNNSTYTVSSSDEGSTIRVDVSFTDLASNPEGPLPREATAAVVPAAGPCPAGNGCPAPGIRCRSAPPTPRATGPGHRPSQAALPKIRTPTRQR